MKSGDIRSYFSSFAASSKGSAATKRGRATNEPDPVSPPPKKRDTKKEETRKKEEQQKKEATKRKEEIPVNPADFWGADDKTDRRVWKKRRQEPSAPAAEPKVEKTLEVKPTTPTSDELVNDVKEVVTSSLEVKEEKADQDLVEIKASTTNIETLSSSSSSPAKVKEEDEAISSSTAAAATVKEENTKVNGHHSKEEKDEKKRQNYLKYVARGGPKHLGSKEFPEAEPDCLHGKSFILTGVLDSFEREDVAAVIKKYGGRVASSISKKIDYVIVGTGAGETKLQKCKDFLIPLLEEDDFLKMLKQHPLQTTQNLEESKPDVKIESNNKMAKHSQDSGILDPNSEEIEASPMKVQSPSKAQADIKRPAQGIKVLSNAVLPPPTAPVASTSQSSTTITATTTTTVSTPVSSLMWVDKYKPTALKSLVGQIGESSNAKKLLRWLQNWFKYHGSATDKAKAAYPALKDPEGRTFKVALLSGPPGIGKTTTAQLCCKESGYTFTELNASDTRNKNSLQGGLSDALDNLQVNFTIKPGSSSHDNGKMIRRHVIIMDEVDGMSGSQDRGGIAELIMLLKTSRIPIICICNDRNSKKIRSLANYCFDLRFKPPSLEQLRGFIQSVCFKEKIKIPREMQQQVITSTDFDIRQILHQMQMFKEVESSTDAYNPKKDLHFGPWDVARKVFSAQEHNGMTLDDKSLLFFHDYQLGPLFVHDNYLRCTPKAAKGNRYKTMDLISATAKSLIVGDRIEKIIRSTTDNWSLLPTQGIYQSVLPGTYMETDYVPRMDFPAWFGKNSNQGKRSRLLQQLHTHMHLHVSGNLEALNMDYLPYLRRSIVNPLVKEDIETATSYMTNYSLVREDLDIINEVALWPNMRDLFTNLDSKSKAAFTRKVNKESFVPYSVIKTVSKRGKGGAGGNGEDDELGLEEDEEEAEGAEEVEEDEIENDAMIKQKKPKAKAGDSNKTKASNTSKLKASSKASSSKSKGRK